MVELNIDIKYVIFCPLPLGGIMVTLKKALLALMCVTISGAAFAAEKDVVMTINPMLDAQSQAALQTSLADGVKATRNPLVINEPVNLSSPSRRSTERGTPRPAIQKNPSLIEVEVDMNALEEIQDAQATQERAAAHSMSQSPKRDRTYSSGTVTKAKLAAAGDDARSLAFEDYDGRVRDGSADAKPGMGGDVELGEIGKSKRQDDFHGVGPSFAQRCEEAILEGTGEAVLWGSTALSQVAAAGFISEAAGAPVLPDAVYYVDAGLYTGINGLGLAQKAYQFHKKRTTPILPIPASTPTPSRCERVKGTVKALAQSAKENPATAALVVASGVSQLSAGFLLAEAMGSAYEPMKLYVGDSAVCTALNIGAAGKALKDKCFKKADGQ